MALPPSDNPTDDVSVDILYRTLEAQVVKHLEQKALEHIRKDIKQIAANAVKQWYEVRMSLEHNNPYDYNINIALVERVIKTIVENQPQINIQDKHHEYVS